jgi:hypothetical protein
MHSIFLQDKQFIYNFLLAPTSALSKAGRNTIGGGQAQRLNSVPCGVGPSASTMANKDLLDGSDHVGNMPSSHCHSAFSVAPAEFHAQHFMQSSEKADVHAKDVWMWFWPVESKELPTPLKDNEPILSQCPKASTIACCLCSTSKHWKAYKLCDGIVMTLWNHLRTHHRTTYEGYLWSKIWETEHHMCEGAYADDDPFHLAGFLKWLIRWIVVNDQASTAFKVSVLCALSNMLIIWNSVP